MTAERPDLAAEFAAVLGEHRPVVRTRLPDAIGIIHGDRRCTCGQALPWTEYEADHRAHVAAVLAGAAEAWGAGERAAALREQAETFRTLAGASWGGDERWLTTGTDVAELAAEWCDESAWLADERRPRHD